MMTSSRMRPVMFLTEDGLQIRGAYWDARTEGALSLLLVHDNGADRSVWDSYVGFFLSRGWSVLTIDLRGHGESVRQEARSTLLGPGMPPTGLDTGYRMDIQAALAFLARQVKADPVKRAIVGLGLGADLAYAASARGWGASSVVCVSPDDGRARALAGPGTFAPRGAYLMYGAYDPVGSAAAIPFATCALFPAECMTYDDTGLTGIHLWDERQPEIVARSIAWIERTI